MSPLTAINLPASVSRLASGKVRDLYDLAGYERKEKDKTGKSLLFVASDRISAYDVVLASGIPDKGVLLTQLSHFWFGLLPTLLADARLSVPFRTHFVASGLPPALVRSLPADLAAALRPRSMQVRRLRVFPIEAIVRGYLTGSAWVEYRDKGTVHGIPVPEGLQLGQRFPQGALYTPSTKAEAGAHDENIHPDEAARIVGESYAARIAELAVAIYEAARAYAEPRGIIVADTKFEFGLDEETDEVVLADEVLTPDSSRFWSAEEYEVGKEQESFDKQSLRDWLAKEGLKGKEDVKLPEDVVRETERRYKDAFARLVGKKVEDMVAEI